MALQDYASQPGRINKLLGQILAHAEPVEVTGNIGIMKDVPKNKGDTVIFRRWIPVNSTNQNLFFPTTTTGGQATATDRGNQFVQQYIAAEGITPGPLSLTAQDYPVTLQQLVIIFGFSDKMADQYEDDIPTEYKLQVGHQLGLAREMIRFGAIKASTNQFYGGTGTTRATVNGKLTLPLLRKVIKYLQAHHAKTVTKVLKPGVEYGTVAVSQAYMVYTHTDLNQDVYDLPKFKDAVDYAAHGNVLPNEIGAVEFMRFIASPDLPSVTDAGAAIGSLGLQSNLGTYIDVYQVIVAGADAWGSITMKNAGGLASSNDVSVLLPGDKDKNDPAGQRGYVTAKNWFNAIVVNSDWVAVVNVGTTA
jgi:N4-gp56 family major capsid protein